MTLSPIYFAIASDVFGPVEFDEYVDVLQSKVEKAAMNLSYGAYQNAFSELRAIGQKPVAILDMPETGVQLFNRAELEDALEDELDALEDALDALEDALRVPAAIVAA